MITERTKAILLLTGYLPGGSKRTAKPLSGTEWNKLVIFLTKKDLSPEDLLSPNVKDLLYGWNDNKITVERIENLLRRGAALGIALDKWERAGMWILNRGDIEYPSKLKIRLKASSPPIFFGVGNKKILNTPAIGVVGSRNASPEDLKIATSFGKSVVRQGYSIVSGGAKGIDESSMLGALENDGTCIGVLADSLLKKASSKLYRNHILRNNLVLISPYNPEARFNVGTAMGRNKLIYAISGATVVIHSGRTGGTWSGAIENLRNKWVPLWVKVNNDSDSGNLEIIKKGGKVLPDDVIDWKVELLIANENIGTIPKDLFSGLNNSEPEAKTINKKENTGIYSSVRGPETLPKSDLHEEDIFFSTFMTQFKELTIQSALTKEQIASELNLLPTQVMSWLKRGMKSDKIEKVNKPVRYRIKS